MPIRLNRPVIIALLKGAGKSQTALAGALEISSPYLHDLLHGRRNAEAYVANIAQFLNVEPSEIIEGSAALGEES